MSLCTNLATSDRLPTPPKSAAPSLRDSTCKESKYPPGIEAIIGGSSSKRRNAIDTGSYHIDSRLLHLLGTAHPLTPESSGHSVDVHISPTNALEHSICLETDDNVAVDRAILNQAPSVSSRATAVDMLQSVAQNLCRVRDEMYTILREYFHRDIIINLFEVPSYKHLRRSLEKLIGTLGCIERSLLDERCIGSDIDAKVMFYAIKVPLDAVVAEGLTLLKIWNRRDVGQKPDEPLIGKNRTLRAITIHDSDGRLHNLDKMVTIADALVLQELEERQPPLEKTKREKKWRWLGYFRPICPVLGECEHERHQKCIR